MGLTNKKLWIAITVAVYLASLGSRADLCVRALFAFGAELESCPDGAVRQSASLQVSQARRGATDTPGTILLQVVAHYTTGGADAERRGSMRAVDAVQTWLTGGAQASWPLAIAWRPVGDALVGALRLPDVPDGDYQVHARYTTPLGSDEVAAPLALYTPARIHVITDRPLYEPGNTVRFRAVALRARDLAPLDHRPGVWTVRDPDNEILLEEAAPAGDWGVVAGSFPLDKAARPGTWKVAWRSADAVDEVAITVQPFTLPRFRVDAVASKPFYQPGDAPGVKGAVIYSSGAPVAGAALDIAWEVAGAWPAPAGWLAGGLPRRAVTAANGRFELALPAVPADLQGRATLTARISAVDPAGDRVEGAASVLLSQDGIVATAVTELGDGLVQSFNNRLFLRVTTPDGRVVSNAAVHVRRAWQPSAPTVDALLDEDGVASLQLDPGAPVNIVIPALPWRPAPKKTLVARGEPRELIGGQGASLADQVELDRWLAPLAACAIQVAGSEATVRLGLRVAASGAVLAAGAGASALERCAVELIKRQHLPAGGERLYALDLQFFDPELPNLTLSIESTSDTPAGLEAQLAELARTARSCLPAEDGKLASLLSWRAHAGRKDVELTGWLADAAASGGRAALACAMPRFARAQITLADPAPADALGVARFQVSLPASAAQHRPQPTTMLGYELDIMADLAGGPTTKLRVAPGTVPDLRMRVTPVLAKPGEPVTAQLIRGPQFTGALPAKLALDCAKQHVEQPLDPEHRATLTIGPDASGWCSVTSVTGGVRALVYVRPKAELAVSVVPRHDRYAPGEMAELTIQTTVGGQGGKAAVGLFGVDDSLGQLVPLPGPDALARVQPVVTTAAPAFGVLDGQALALGRIRGANAAAATVLRVSEIPSAPELDAVADAHGQSAFDPIAELTDRFYIVLAELHVQVHAWETTAPAAEKMTPATMARLWRAALDACAARGARVDDAYGRRLRLARLPDDLLSLTDPRAVVVTATRLPEDVENWAAWVRREKP